MKYIKTLESFLDDVPRISDDEYLYFEYGIKSLEESDIYKMIYDYYMGEYYGKAPVLCFNVKDVKFLVEWKSELIFKLKYVGNAVVCENDLEYELMYIDGSTKFIRTVIMFDRFNKEKFVEKDEVDVDKNKLRQNIIIAMTDDLLSWIYSYEERMYGNVGKDEDEDYYDDYADYDDTGEVNY
jgi:hypothetical protein